MKIAIISAMEKELKDILKLLSNKEEVRVNNYTFYLSKDGKNDLILTVGGIGKVQTGMIMGTLFTNFNNIDLVINLGVSGGIKEKVNPGDVVIGENYCFCDVDATFNAEFEYGQVPYLPKLYNSPIDYLNKIKSQKYDNVVFGDILTGDTFFTDKEAVDKIINKHFSDLNVCCMDMESCAFAEASYIYHAPFLAIRAISDVIGNDNQATEYYDYVLKACEKSTLILMDILRKWA